MTRICNGAFYFNPDAGKGIVTMDEIRAKLEPHAIDLVPLDKELDITADIRARQATGQRLFIAGGGDGTVHHVVQALVNTDSAMGIVPLGTFNHLARDLHLPLNWSRALDVALEGRERHVDVGRVNGVYFANNISLGLYPQVVLYRERMRRKVGKWIAYPLALVVALRRLTKLSMTVEAPPNLEVVHTHLFFVSANPYNLSHLGMIAPRETLEGGRLAIYWLPESFFGGKLFRALFRYARGKGAKIDKLRRLQTDTLRVHSNHRKMAIGIDGELIDLEPPLQIVVVRSALLVRVAQS